MVYEPGELKTMQSGKEIDLNTTLPIMIDIMNALRQVNSGVIPGVEEKLTDNKRKMNQVRGLNRLISSLEMLITIGEGQVDLRSLAKWNKKNKGVEKEKKEQFNEEDLELEDMKYDINKLRFWDKFLHNCRKSILLAEKTNMIQDDFLIIKHSPEGEVYELTENFFDMRSDLRKCFSEIQKIMMINKVIAAGIQEDEELTYREQEQMFIERVRDS